MKDISRRGLGRLALAAAATVPATARAQTAPSGAPIRIGYSMSLSGGLAGNGRPALLAHRIWAEDVNAKGGLLGRPVELVHYDDQSTGAQVPGIYTKLIDVDKVDLVVSGYATAIIAPATPVVMQRNMTFVSLFGTGVNSDFKYDRYFSINPAGSDVKETFAKGFFDIAMAMDPKPRSIALVNLDSDFHQRTAESARYLAGQNKLRVVYDRAYPPSTVDFTPILRSVQAARPDVVYIGSYPPDTAGLLRAASELRVNFQLFGGPMIGPHITAQKLQLGPILNNLVVWDVYAPEPTLQFPGTSALIERYQPLAAKENADALGHYVPPLAYTQMQVLEQAVKRVGSLDQAALAADMHKNQFDTVIGPLRFDALGEWTEERNLYTQYQGVQGNGIEQFRKPGTQVILYPQRYKSGELRKPYTAGA
ncbi:branched-chain amino acid ABC transporter substrate-binding protein [Pseudoroseomonas wenyumeiae]|uniref:Branched-chain amino acid ABC transporter substrate-binding protein n=1 Tax=Teichococcus wenyumeiae TaxID=2478470 RepID=A0A3A9JFS7_9PROT|nr:amino acid ABC transporter substrate-binding protein [Pseudoroseomonas wenyumeiae]RKK05442.1 branched-chain amino acid ABC transporter substrate-binding protein [Pseudoroseomonas wenyumeiae]RMI19620.1 branched-chain amino acid ABC transporter substrate-binding protein [Pseudoroseomonas wenyumeiae]